jgi:hypothetical protein
VSHRLDTEHAIRGIKTAAHTHSQCFGESRMVPGMPQLSTLWRGDYALADAFWTWAVTLGVLVNVVTSVLFLILITQDLAWPALVIGYGVSLPYNLVALVGVWRSAARYDGPVIHADLARGATVVLMATLSLT